jgi:hypothetical protein
MSRYLKLSMIALLALVIIVPVASARPFVFVGGGGFYGPGYYGPGWRWYGPYGYAPYGYGYGYERGPVVGSVKIDTKMKDAGVYVDGSFAGTVGELKTFQLRPGDHNIDLRTHDGNSFYQERIEVIAGKTIKILPK